MWVFSDHFEIWHEHSLNRCITHFYQPPPIPVRQIEKKSDARKLPRTYHHCRQCGVRFAQPKDAAQTDTEGDTDTDLCKSCRNQEELFGDGEITKPQGGLSGEPE